MKRVLIFHTVVAFFTMTSSFSLTPAGRFKIGAHRSVSVSQLDQLASMTVLSVDTGDLDVIEKMASTGLITDATTNPLFVSQAGLSGDPRYAQLVTRAVSYGITEGEQVDEDTKVALAMDRLAVNLGIGKTTYLLFN